MSYNRAYTLIILLLGVMVTGCEDPIPDDYVQELVIEGFVIAGEPITHLRIYRSLPLNDTFSLQKAMIRDADVTLLENGVPVPMMFVDDSTGFGYRPSDTTFRCKYGTEYALTVRALNRTATATARTLNAFDWVRRPVDTMQYPGRANELTPVDSLGISWTGQPGVLRYVLAVECIDTLNYGLYLQPPTSDSNRRIRTEDFEDGSLIANERTRYGFSLVSNTPVVWAAFKWFGKQRIHVYAGDEAFQEWYSSVGFGRRSQYDYRLSNIRGGLGTFAGASKITADVFLKKDVP